MAGLANLELTEEEIGVYTKQLREIISYVEQLSGVDTSGVEPTYQTLDGAVNAWREDEVGPSLTQEEALGQARRTKDGYFVTAGVFEEVKGDKDYKGYKSYKGGIREKIDKYNAILTEIFNEETPRSGGESPLQKIGHKDLFLTKGVETTAGSRVLEGYLPQYCATVVERFEKAGYKTKYKFNCDAWAHGSSGENSDFGATKNPWNQEFTPGGSSSGSAAAVAAGLVDFATGTDTGGSIRLPASFCGVVGLKPTYGAASRYGIVAMASSLDCPGLIGRSVEEVEKAFGVMAGPDKRDATSGKENKDYKNYKDYKNIRAIGVPKEYLTEGVDGEVKQAVMEAARVLENSGMKVKEVSLPNSKYGIAVYYLVQTTEVASNLGRYDGIRYGQDRKYFGAEAKRRIMLGTFASSTGYAAKFFEKAARVRTLIIKDFEKVFEKVDVLLGPVSPTPPFKLGEKTDNPLQMYLSDILTVPVNLAGLPGLALPCGFSGGGKAILPIGMQLIGPRWEEEVLFEVGKVYQRLTDKDYNNYKYYKDERE